MAVAEQQSIVGKITSVKFKSETDGFMILNVKTDDGNNKTVKGYHMPTAKNIPFRFIGQQIHRSGKRYFRADTYEDVAKEELVLNNDTIKYIASGIFPGIGTKSAQAIYAKFGEDSIDIIENHTSKLGEVGGFSATKISKIKTAVEENRFLQEFVKEMMKYGITADRCARLASMYGKEVMDVIKKNPYCMIKSVKLSFKDADEIALKMGIEEDANVRLDATFRHVMNCFYAMGHTGAELQSFLGESSKLLGPNVTFEKITKRCEEYIKNKWYRLAKQDIDGHLLQFVFTSTMVKKEEQLCESIVRLSKNEIRTISNIKEKIKEIEDIKGFTLDPLQRQAIETGLEKPLVVITGGPGTGKTTIMQFITAIFENETGKTAVLLAPTGKAARKLTEYTKHVAKTIHSHFNIFDLDAEAEDMRIESIDDNLVIVDEFSMIDTDTAHILLGNIGNGSRTILVGDIDQLPSVGAGAVLRDIINSNVCSVIRLDKIFRAGEESLIHINTQNVNHGIKDIRCGDDFHMYGESDMEKCKTLMTDIYKKRVAKYGVEGTVLLLPYRKDTGGVEDMNKHLQSIINPPADDKHEVKVGGTIYRVGDVVMHVRSNTPEASNGDTGIVTEALDIEGEIQVRVKMNGKTLTYDRIDLSFLDLAYAMTIHKSQGSEYPAVITCITSNHGAMLYRNIPYVAFSRGKKVDDVIYDIGLYKAIETQISDNRHTLLGYFLKREMGFMVYDIF